MRVGGVLRIAVVTVSDAIAVGVVVGTRLAFTFAFTLALSLAFSLTFAFTFTFTFTFTLAFTLAFTFPFSLAFTFPFSLACRRRLHADTGRAALLGWAAVVVDAAQRRAKERGDAAGACDEREGCEGHEQAPPIHVHGPHPATAPCG